MKSSSLLESAIHCPMGEGAYPTIFEEAAALFESLGQNHPFQNANKRTTFAAMVVMLRYNGYLFIMDTKAAEDFTVDMVNHKYKLSDLAEIIQKHSQKKA